MCKRRAQRILEGAEELELSVVITAIMAGQAL